MSRIAIVTTLTAALVAGCSRERASQPTAPLVVDDNPIAVSIAEQIHKAVADDPSMSPAARRITILADGGGVSLHGSVATDPERAAIERLAVAIAGDGNVRDELSVITGSDTVAPPGAPPPAAPPAPIAAPPRTSPPSTGGAGGPGALR